MRRADEYNKQKEKKKPNRKGVFLFQFCFCLAPKYFSTFYAVHIFAAALARN